MLRKVFFLIIFFFFTNLYAQTSNKIIAEIDLQNLKYAPRNSILNISQSVIGQELKEITIINTLKKIYTLGYFQDIRVEVENLTNNKAKLIFIFSELDILEEIIFEGNRKLTDKKLKENLTSKSNEFVNEEIIQNDLEKIKSLYIDEGYNQAKIIYRLEKKEQGKKNLIFQILEKDKVYLTKIRIQGSKFFLPIDLERMISSKEIDCFSWIQNSGKLDKKKLDTDLQIIRQTYLQNGFIDISIADANIKFIYSKAFVTAEVDIVIEEGQQFFIDNIEIEKLEKNQDSLYSKKQIFEVMQLKKGDVYDVFKQQQDRVAINNLYQNAGYAFSRTLVRQNVDREKRKVNLFYFIEKKEKVYLNRIGFIGNQETRDNVIRRELTIYDGELFNNKKIRKSRDNIAKLGYFTPGVGVQEQRQVKKEDNKLNYFFHLQETLTGNFSGGLGFSDTLGLSANISLTKSNFLGTGRRVGLRYEKGENNSVVDLSFTEPYLLGSKWQGSFNVASEFANKSTSNLGYDRQIERLSLNFSYPFWKNWTTNLSAGYTQTSRSNFDNNISSRNPKTTNNNIENGYTYSTVNNPFFPSNGNSHNLRFLQAGGSLGGEENYRRLLYEHRYFHSILPLNKLVFYYRFRLQKLFSIDDNLIPVSARFSLGGSNSIRGFNNFEIAGPSSPAEWPIGFTEPTEGSKNYDYYINHRNGIEEILSNIELNFPLSRTGQNLRGVFFFDVGNVFAEERMYEIIGRKRDYNYLRAAYGTGVRIITPLGVFKFEYGIKLNPRPTETNSLFQFTISNLF